MNKIDISRGRNPIIPNARSIENTTIIKMLKNISQTTKKVGKKIRRHKKK